MKELTNENIERVLQFIVNNLKRSTFTYGNIAREEAVTKYLERDGEIIAIFNLLSERHLSLLFSPDCTKEEIEQVITEAYRYKFEDGTVVGLAIDDLTDYFDFDRNKASNEVASMIVDANSKFTIDSKVQTVELEDLEQFIRSNNSVFNNNYDIESVKASHQHNLRSMIIEDGKVVSGATITAISNKTAVVVGVFTLEQYRGRGYARKVLEHALNRITDQERLVMIFFSNPVAKKIYLDMGFDVDEKLIMFKRKQDK